SEVFAFGDFCQFLFYNFVAQLDALITNVDPGACNELSYLILCFPTERTLQQICRFSDSSHFISLCALLDQHNWLGAYSRGGCARSGYVYLPVLPYTFGLKH